MSSLYIENISNCIHSMWNYADLKTHNNNFTHHTISLFSHLYNPFVSHLMPVLVRQGNGNLTAAESQRRAEGRYERIHSTHAQRPQTWEERVAQLQTRHHKPRARKDRQIYYPSFWRSVNYCEDPVSWGQEGSSKRMKHDFYLVINQKKGNMWVLEVLEAVYPVI